MIWSLAREQVRSQRRYTAWASIVVALAVGTAVYGALLATTLSASGDAQSRALVLDAQYSSYGMTGQVAPGAEFSVVTPDDIRAAVETAQQQGTRVGAIAQSWTLAIEKTDESPYFPWAQAAIGDIDWDAIVIDGNGPATGQVALSEAYASRLSLGLGDTVTFYSDASAGAPLGLTATVSGITRSPFDAAGLTLQTLPDLWIAWDTLNDYFAAVGGVDENLPIGDFANVDVTWDGESAVLAQLFGPETIYEPGDYTGENTATPWIVLGTAVLIIGAVAMAFAFGRAQAQSRTQWVATARALGASRRHVLLGTLVESGLLAAIGFVGGVAIGWIGTTVHLAVLHAQVPGAGVSSLPVGLALVAFGALALATFVALVVAGVPAFWATRVSPTAALKPENDITNSEVGRRVAFWPVAAVWAAAGVGAVLSADPSEVDGAPLYGVMLAWLFIILTLLVANESLRWLLPRMGGWLSRRPEKSAIIAGDSIVARPRQFSVPALLMALGAAALLVWSVTGILSTSAMYAAEGNGAYPYATLYEWVSPTWLAPATIIVMGAITVLVTVITVATTSVTARERATREALGASPGQTRAGAAIAQGVALFTGLVVGLVLAAVLVAANVLMTQETGWNVGQAGYVALGATTRAVAIVVGSGAVLSLLSSLVVAAAARAPAVPGLPPTASAGKSRQPV